MVRRVTQIPAVADKNVADICFINFPVVGTYKNITIRI